MHPKKNQKKSKKNWMPQVCYKNQRKRRSSEKSETAFKHPKKSKKIVQKIGFWHPKKIGWKIGCRKMHPKIKNRKHIQKKSDEKSDENPKKIGWRDSAEKRSFGTPCMRSPVAMLALKYYPGNRRKMFSKYRRNESADPAKLNQNRGVGSRHKPRNQKCAIQSKSMPRSSIFNVLHHRMDNVQGSDNDKRARHRTCGWSNRNTSQYRPLKHCLR